MKKTFCDVCGEECKRRVSSIKLEGNESVKLYVNHRTFQHRVTCDICFSCQIAAMSASLSVTDKEYTESLIDELADYD